MKIAWPIPTSPLLPSSPVVTSDNEGGAWALSEPSFDAAREARLAAASNRDATPSRGQKHSVLDLRVMGQLARRKHDKGLPDAPHRDGLGPVPDPLPTAAHRKDKSVTRITIDGPLFDGRPSPNDGAQGEVGDCFGLGPLAAAAAADPALIERLIVPSGTQPNVWLVTCYVEQEDGSVGQKTVEVDNDFWCDQESGAPAYCSGRELGDGKRVLWMMLVEKALTKLYTDEDGPKDGSFSSIDGGYEANVLFALTGSKAKQTIFNTEVDDKAGQQAKKKQLAKVAERAWGRLQAGHAAGAAMVMGTPGEAGTEIDPELNKLGICGGHVYAVLDIRERNGVREVRLQNPWLSFEPGDTDPEADAPTPDDGVEDGAFWKPIEWLVEVFQDLHISGV